MHLLSGLLLSVLLMSQSLQAEVVTNIVIKDVGLWATQCDGRSNRGGAPRLELSAEVLSDWAPGQGTLLKFDLRPNGVPVLPPGQAITNAELRLRSFQADNVRWKSYIVAYPLLKDWNEGVGGANSTALPWFPTSVGDSCPMFRYVTSVEACNTLFNGGEIEIINTNGWNSWKNESGTVAKDGEPWAAMSARGLGEDIADRKMIDQLWVSSTNYPALASYPPGSYYPVLRFTPEGLKVLEEWARGKAPNYGFNIWAICPPLDMLPEEPATRRVFPPRLSSKEKAPNAEEAYPPELVIYTAWGNQTYILLR